MSNPLLNPLADKLADLQREMSATRSQLDAEMQKREMERAYQDLQNKLSIPVGRGLGSVSGIGSQQVSSQYASSMQKIGSTPYKKSMNKTSDKVLRKEVTIDEAKKLLVPLLATPIVPFLWGPPGIGKSQMIKAICKEQDWDLIDLRLSLLNPVDLRGLPVINKEDRLADWYHPSFLPNGRNKKPGILFLDEINLAPLSVQAAAYQLILDKRVGEYRFPDHWKIIAAGNRETDRANVYKISAPLANRFAHFTIIPDFASWREWAMTTGKIRPEIIDFLIVRPALLFQMPRDSEKAFPSPRTWSFLSSLLDAYGYDEDGGVSAEVEHVTMGTIGDAVGSEFMVHLKNYNLKSVGEKIDRFIATGKIELPDRPEALRFAIIQAILDAHLSDKVTDTRYKAFLKKLSGEEKATVESEKQKRLEPFDTHDFSDEPEADLDEDTG